MRSTRIHSTTPLAADARLELAEPAVRHIAQVLRMTAGDTVVMFDGSGSEFIGTIESATKSRVVVRLGPARQPLTEAAVQVCLWHGMCRSDRMDTVVQKATELGVTEIQPVITERDVMRLDARRAARKLEHWISIAISACEQSGRVRVPVIKPPATLQTCLQEQRQRFGSATTALLCDPEGQPGLRQHLGPAGTIIVLTGPEGGFSPAEKTAAMAAGFVAVSLGPRILRTETAPVVMLSLIQGLAGDLRA
jgi:16S rRNA (uracil1498-N3)-methyltransferase